MPQHYGHRIIKYIISIVRNIRRKAFTYVFADFLMLNIGWTAFSVVRYHFLPENIREHYTLFEHLTQSHVIAGQIVAPLVMLAIYWLSGYYGKTYFKSRLDELGNTAVVSAIGALGIFFIAIINDTLSPGVKGYYELIGILWLLWFVPVYLVRLIQTTHTARRIQRRELAFNTLVIGATKGGKALVDRLNAAPRGSGINVIGYVDTDTTGTTATQRSDLGLPVYRLEDLPEICRTLDVTNLIVIPHRGGIRQTGQLINTLFPLDRTILIPADLYSIIAARPRMFTVTGEPLIDISHSQASKMTLNLKRTADVAVAATALLLLLPLFAVLALAVRLDSRGCIFYKQQRIGYHKKPFYIYKFRTMRADAEASGPALSTLDDPRITHVGHFLRKYRLDELPQFWNVLRGDMSLVGPRPEREYYIRQIVARAPYYSLLHQVRPGITSWGMVKYGYASNVDQMLERLRYDLLYIDNVSMAVDLKILFFTIHTVFTGKGI